MTNTILFIIVLLAILKYLRQSSTGYTIAEYCLKRRHVRLAFFLRKILSRR